jgi:putative endonuclease
MREVEASNIHSSPHQLFKPFLTICRWSYGTYDLCSTHLMILSLLLEPSLALIDFLMVTHQRFFRDHQNHAIWSELPLLPLERMRKDRYNRVKQVFKEAGAMMSDTNSTEPLRKHEESPPGHFVYLVQCSNGTFYTGYTTNVEKRVAAHNAGKGAKYTRAHLPVLLVASWSCSSKREALRAEWAIKRLSRAQKSISLSRPSKAREHCLTGSYLRVKYLMKIRQAEEGSRSPISSLLTREIALDARRDILRSLSADGYSLMCLKRRKIRVHKGALQQCSERFHLVEMPDPIRS